MELHLDALPRTLSLEREGGKAVLAYVDQTALPARLEVRRTADWRQVVQAIKVLAVRGAPAIGVAGAAAVALRAYEGGSPSSWLDDARVIAGARPTAVNLRWAVQRACALVVSHQDEDPHAVADLLFSLVKDMEAEDERVNRAIGANGAALLGPESRILTHCNAGSLATVFFGTALGVVYAAAQQGKVQRVFADETRPLGQGARLTSWELARAGVPVTLLCDNMAASLMATGQVDAVIVGADRIAQNGDFANKIGTYGVAVLASEHGVPLYVAAPWSTVDLSTPTGNEIVIEQRDPAEVLPHPIEGVDVYNPAFDVTPARLASLIVTERGVVEPASIAMLA